MATHKYLTTETGITIFRLGSSDSATLSKMFSGAPQYDGYRPDVVMKAGNLLLKDGVVGNVTIDAGGAVSDITPDAGNTLVEGFNRDYANIPDISDAALANSLGGPGNPGTANSPNPDITGGLTAVEIRKIEGSGGAFEDGKIGGKFPNPSIVSDKIADQTIENILPGTSTPAP